MKKRVLFEDASMYYNKWTSGMASREMATQKVGLKELLKQEDEHTIQNPGVVKVGNALPYPVPNAVSILGELITSASNSLSLFRHSLKNPVVANDKKARAEIVLIVNTLKGCLSLLNRLIVNLQRIK